MKNRLAILLVCILLVMLTPAINAPPVVAEPSQTDWVVTDDEVVENQTITLDGNLIVKGGGSLTLRNVTLTMDCQYDQQHGISVEDGGSLFIYDSKIAPVDQAHGFSFTVDNANFEMKNSELHQARAPGGEGVGGRFVSLLLEHVDGAIITGNTIYHAEDVVAILLKKCQSAMIKNNKIYSANTEYGRSGGIHLSRANNNTVADNYFYAHKEVVSICNSWNNHVANNVADMTVAAHGIEVSWGSGNNIIEGNTLRQLGGEHTIIGLEILATPYPNLFLNNTVERARTCAVVCAASNQMLVNNHLETLRHEAIQLYHAYNNLIVNNVVTGNRSLTLVVGNGIKLLASSDNTIQGNQILDCREGIGLHYSSDNNIVEANFLENNPTNIVVDDSQGNTITGNNFITRGYQGYDNDGDNNWSRNYWSDYDGKARGDGIGETPYIISPRGRDDEPLIGSLPVTAAPVPTFEPVAIEKGLPITTDEHIRDSVTWKDQVITLKGNLTVEEGGSLTLDNATLTVDEEAMRATMLEIRVEPGAALYIYGSKIIGPERDCILTIEVFPGAQLVIKDSELRNLGRCEGAPGLKNWADGVIIENNTFIGNYWSIWALTSSHHRIVNNTVSKSFFGIKLFGGPSYFKKCLVKDNNVSQIAHNGWRWSKNYYTFPWISLIMFKVQIITLAGYGVALALVVLGAFLIRRKRRRIRHE